MTHDASPTSVLLDDAQVKTLAPEALSPAAIEAKAESVAVVKGALPVARCFVLAMLAGAFIAFGGALFGLVSCDAELPFAVSRCLGGLCFSLGLLLVLCCGAELFTGNSLMVCGLMSRKVTAGAILKNWVVVWLGNLAGALLAVFLVFMGNLQGMNAGALGDTFVGIAAGKAALAPSVVFFKGIMCNVLVCLAVWIGFGARTVADKMLGIALPIMAFVAMGFEHCVANMFFFGMGLACQGAGFGSAAIDLGGVAMNMGLSTLGNIVGGGVLVGLAYWFAYAKRAAK